MLTNKRISKSENFFFLFVAKISKPLMKKNYNKLQKIRLLGTLSEILSEPPCTSTRCT